MENGESPASGHLVIPSLADYLRLARRVEELEEFVRDLARPRVWMDKHQASDYTSLSVSMIEKKTAKREIPFHRVDGCNRYRVDELDEWMTLRVSSVSTPSNGRAPRQRPRPGTGNGGSDALPL